MSTEPRDEILELKDRVAALEATGSLKSNPSYPKNCYCVCHSPNSSSPSCVHCAEAPSEIAELRLLKSIGSFSEEQMKIITAYHSQAYQAGYDTRTLEADHEHEEDLQSILTHTKVKTLSQGGPIYVQLGTLISYGDNWKVVMEIIEAHTRQEVLKERLSLLEALKVLFDGTPDEPFGEFGNNLNILIEESKAALHNQKGEL